MSGVNLNSTALVEDYDEDSKSISQEDLGNAPAYGRKLVRWLGKNEEVYIRDISDLEEGQDYTIEYRDGRFGSSENLESFEKVEAALEEGREIAEKKIASNLQ